MVEDISGVGMKLCRDIYSRWQVRTLADGLMFGNAKALWLETADSIGSVNRRHKVAIQETNSAELKIFDLESRINALINGFLKYIRRYYYRTWVVLKRWLSGNLCRKCLGFLKKP